MGPIQAPAIIFGTELEAQDKGYQKRPGLADLFLLVGKPGTSRQRPLTVAEKNNTRGVCEVGVVSRRLPVIAPGRRTAASFWKRTRWFPNPPHPWRKC